MKSNLQPVALTSKLWMLASCTEGIPTQDDILALIVAMALEEKGHDVMVEEIEIVHTDAAQTRKHLLAVKVDGMLINGDGTFVDPQSLVAAYADKRRMKTPGLLSCQSLEVSDIEAFVSFAPEVLATMEGLLRAAEENSVLNGRTDTPESRSKRPKRL